MEFFLNLKPPLENYDILNVLYKTAITTKTIAVDTNNLLECVKKYPKIVKIINKRVAAFNLRSSDKSPMGSISRIRCSLNRISKWSDQNLSLMVLYGIIIYIY